MRLSPLAALRRDREQNPSSGSKLTPSKMVMPESFIYLVILIQKVF